MPASRPTLKSRRELDAGPEGGGVAALVRGSMPGSVVGVGAAAVGLAEPGLAPEGAAVAWPGWGRTGVTLGAGWVIRGAGAALATLGEDVRAVP